MWTWAGQLPHGSPSPTGGFFSCNIYQQYPIPHPFHAVLWKLHGIYKSFTYLLVLGKIKMSLLQKPLGEVSCVWVWTPQWTLLKSRSTSPASDTQPCSLHTWFQNFHYLHATMSGPLCWAPALKEGRLTRLSSFLWPFQIIWRRNQDTDNNKRCRPFFTAYIFKINNGFQTYKWRCNSE